MIWYYLTWYIILHTPWYNYTNPRGADNNRRRNNAYDRDEVEAEQEERRMRRALDREFESFAKKICDAVRVDNEWERRGIRGKKREREKYYDWLLMMVMIILMVMVIMIMLNCWWWSWSWSCWWSCWWLSMSVIDEYCCCWWVVWVCSCHIDCHWWAWMMTLMSVIDDEYHWWVSCMTIMYECHWWVSLMMMSVIDEYEYEWWYYMIYDIDTCHCLSLIYIHIPYWYTY